MTRDDHAEPESLEVISLASGVETPTSASHAHRTLSRSRLTVGVIVIAAVAAAFVTVAVVAHGGGTHITPRTTVSPACAKAMFTMAHEPSNAMDAMTAADEVATVVSCRSAAEWSAAAAPYTSTDEKSSAGGAPGSGYAPLLSLQQFCIQARGIPTPTCKSN